MKILNLKVINLDRLFKDLMLYLFNDNVMPVDGNEDIPGAKLAGGGPALLRQIKRMLVRTDDLFILYEDVHKLVRFIDERPRHAL